MSKGISQREARALRKRVEELTNERNMQRRAWGRQYPGGVHLGTLGIDDTWFRGRIEGARLLGHAVIVTEESDGKLKFFALPLPA